MKIIKLLLIPLVVIFIIGYIGFNNIVPYAIITRPRVHVNLKPSDLNLESNTLSIQTKDNISLKGYWIKAKTENEKGLMILIHGIGSCKEHYLTLANELSEKGIESIIFDGRAHGESGGDFCTYGFKEKQDISQIVDYVKKKKPNIKIGVWGNSLGGAIAIQALEHDNRINFGVIESTFTDLSQIVFDYKKRLLKGFGIRFLSNFALKKAGEIGDFNPDKVKPIKSVKNISKPMFLSHGDSDENISMKYGKQLFENLKSTNKEFTLVKGAGHFNVLEKGGIEYKNNIMNFINRNFE